MIERYTLPEMGRIWSEEYKFKTWLEVELVVCDVLAELGDIPAEAAAVIRKRASFEIERVVEIEATTHHDVIAFLTNVAEHVGPEARYIHLGLTSSDLLDTALSCQLKEAGSQLLSRIARLKAVVKKRALEHKNSVMVGRTHGIHAEPITFGLKLAVWYDELSRRETTVKRALDTVSYGKISGAVGTYAHIDRRVEQMVMARLGLTPAPVSTQILQRDRHAEFSAALALLASSLEKFAMEIRHLQRTEVLEVEEFFQKGQKGSSAMPHKRNPIVSERVCGLARLVRSHALVAMENVPLWHERDISHSSVERVILPDSTIALDYILERFTWVVEKLIVYPEHMQRNLALTNGLIYSQKLMLALTGTGISREEAYKMVQDAAMETWRTGAPFEASVRANDAITARLGEAELARLFTLDSLLSEVEAILERVFT